MIQVISILIALVSILWSVWMYYHPRVTFDITEAPIETKFYYMNDESQDYLVWLAIHCQNTFNTCLLTRPPLDSPRYSKFDLLVADLWGTDLIESWSDLDTFIFSTKLKTFVNNYVNDKRYTKQVQQIKDSK